MPDNQLTIMELVSLQRPSPQERQEVWLKHKKAKDRQAKTISLVLVVACALGFAYIHRHGLGWQRAAELLLIALLGYFIRDAFTAGNRQYDFLAGYEEGVRTGVNRALEITQEDEALIAEVMLDAQSAQDTMREAWSGRTAR